MAALSNVQKPTQRGKENAETEEYVPQKGQDKTPETDLNEMGISDLPDKDFKIMVLKMLTEDRRTMHEQSENFNKERENVRKYQIEITELKSIITELKNSIEGFNSKLDQAKERISGFQDRTVGFI